MDLATQWSALLSEAARPDVPDRSAPARAPTDPGTGFHAFVAARSGALFRGALVLTASGASLSAMVRQRRQVRSSVSWTKSSAASLRAAHHGQCHSRSLRHSLPSAA